MKAESLLGLLVGVIPNSPVRTSLPQTIPMGGNQGNSARETVEELDSGDRSHGKSSVVVDNPVRSGDRSRVSSSSPSGDSLHGRLAGGLGHSVSRPIVERSLATPGSAYKLARAPDSADSSATSTVQVTKQASSVPDRQLNGSFVFKEAGGGDEVSVSPQVDYQNTEASSRSGYSNSTASHHRSSKRVSRSRVKTRSNRPVGVGAVASGIPVGSVAVSMGSSSGGSLRERYESSPASVLLPMPGSGSDGGRRVEKRLARRGSVRLSSGLRAISVSTTLPEGDEPEDSAGSSVVSPSAMGAPSEQPVREALPPLSAVAGASSSASLGLPSSGSSSAAPSAVVSRRQRMKEPGVLGQGCGQD